MDIVLMFILGIAVALLASWLWQQKEKKGWVVVWWHYLLISIWVLLTAFGIWLAVGIWSDAEFVIGAGEMTGALLAIGIFGGLSLVLALVIAQLIRRQTSKYVR